jgi:hypothetical protein
VNVLAGTAEEAFADHRDATLGGEPGKRTEPQVRSADELDLRDAVVQGQAKALRPGAAGNGIGLAGRELPGLPPQTAARIAGAGCLHHGLEERGKPLMERDAAATRALAELAA